MDRLKSIFISSYIAVLLALSGTAIWQLVAASYRSPWSGVLLACLPALLFFAGLFLRPVARMKSRLLFLPRTGVAGTLLALYLGGATWPALLAAVVGVGGSMAYLRWYSRFDNATPPQLAAGRSIPDFDLRDLQGNTVSSRALLDQPTLWLFYRGNWCPFCVAQVRELAGHYQALASRGIRIVLISPQPDTHTSELASRFDVPMQFMVDHDNQAARRLGILVSGGLALGMEAFGYDSDVPRPTVFMTASGGRLIYSDLTENYRVRPEPENFIEIFDQYRSQVAA